MQARMKIPVTMLPEAMEGLQLVSKAVEKSGLSKTTVGFVLMRASQINGCSVCVDMHWRTLKAAGESEERLFAIGAWRDAPYFTDAERAALAMTEAVTRLADRSDPVPDDVWNEAARHYDDKALAGLVLAISLINVFNRVNVATKQVAGEWLKSAEAAEWQKKRQAAS